MRFSKECKYVLYHMYQKRYGYSFVKKYYQISKGNFYYLVRISIIMILDGSIGLIINGLVKGKRRPLIECW